MTACRQCGAEVEPEREHWATPMCFKCLPPPQPLRSLWPASIDPRTLVVSWRGAFSGMCPCQGYGHLLNQSGKPIMSWYFRDRLGDVSVKVWRGVFDWSQRGLPGWDSAEFEVDNDEVGGGIFSDYEDPPCDNWSPAVEAFLCAQGERLTARALAKYVGRDLGRVTP